MNRRLAVLAAMAGLLGAVSSTQTVDAAEAAGEWCMTYCDAIHLGCEKTIGWLDETACQEWHRGCLDGCRVNG